MPGEAACCLQDTAPDTQAAPRSSGRVLPATAFRPELQPGQERPSRCPAETEAGRAGSAAGTPLGQQVPWPAQDPPPRLCFQAWALHAMWLEWKPSR